MARLSTELRTQPSAGCDGMLRHRQTDVRQNFRLRLLPNRFILAADFINVNCSITK